MVPSAGDGEEGDGLNEPTCVGSVVDGHAVAALPAPCVSSHTRHEVIAG